MLEQSIPVEIDASTDHAVHIAHPRALDKTWCGASRNPVPYRWGKPEIDCVVCNDLWQINGKYGWLAGIGE